MNRPLFMKQRLLPMCVIPFERLKKHCKLWAPFAARQKASRIGVVLHGCLQSAIHQWLGPGEGFLLGRDHPFPIGQRLLRVVGVPLDAEALGSDPAEVATLLEGFNPDQGVYEWSTLLIPEGEKAIASNGPLLRLNIYYPSILP